MGVVPFAFFTWMGGYALDQVPAEESFYMLTDTGGTNFQEFGASTLRDLLREESQETALPFGEVVDLCGLLYIIEGELRDLDHSLSVTAPLSPAMIYWLWFRSLHSHRILLL